MSSPIIGGRYEDLQLLTVATGSGATPAVQAVYRGELELYEFKPAGTDQLGGAIELTHSYKEGSALEIHVHWATNSTNATGGVVRWALEYSLANPAPGSAETYVAFANADETVAAGNRQYLTNTFTIALPTNVGGTVSSLFCFNIKRIGSAAEDTYPVSAFVKSFAIHYQIDTIGSNGLSSKN